VFAKLADTVIKIMTWKKTRDLPERELELKFDLPHLRKGDKPKCPLTVSALKKEWNKHKSNPVLLMEYVADYLEIINHNYMSPKERYLLLEYILKDIFPLIMAVVQQHHSEQNFPESDNRRWGINSALSVVQQLAIGYKHLFVNDYTLFDHKYVRARTRLRLCGIRILELVATEQRLSALRYQKLPRQVWRECNQVFFVMYLYEDVDEMHHLIGLLRLPLRALKADAKPVEIVSQMANAKQLYIAIQMFGLVDTLSWPSHYIIVLDAYLKFIESVVTLEENKDNRLPNGHIATYYDHGGPPITMNLEQKDVGVLMDMRPVLDKIDKDYEYADKNTPDAVKKISAPLVVLKQSYRVNFLEMLRERLLPHVRKEERVEVMDDWDLGVYFGFMDSHQHMQDVLKRGKNDASQNSDSLDAILAGRSGTFVEDSRHVKKVPWFVLDESPSGIRLKTKESKYTKPMSLGMLALLEFPEDHDIHIQLGYVCRLQRPKHGEVEITVIRMPGELVSVAIQDVALKESGQAIPGFLIAQDDGRAQLVLHYKQQRHSGAKLHLRGNNEFKDVVLGEATLIQQEFTVFDVEIQK
jgi:hypothetical protein